jgi:hypothetical protein
LRWPTRAGGASNTLATYAAHRLPLVIGRPHCRPFVRDSLVSFSPQRALREPPARKSNPEPPHEERTASRMTSADPTARRRIRQLPESIAWRSGITFVSFSWIGLLGGLMASRRRSHLSCHSRRIVRLFVPAAQHPLGRVAFLGRKKRPTFFEETLYVRVHCPSKRRASRLSVVVRFPRQLRQPRHVDGDPSRLVPSRPSLPAAPRRRCRGSRPRHEVIAANQTRTT